MNRAVWWGAGGGVLALLVAGLWWGAAPQGTPAPAPAAASAGSGAGPVPAPGAALPVPALAGLPSAAAPGVRAPASAAVANRPRLEDIQAELQALSASGRTPQPQELDAVFEKLERYNGGSQMGGVDLQLVRKNLQAAARIQQLSEQMKPLAADPTPENVQKLQALVAEMRQVQATMDVKGLMAAASAMPGGKP